ncbi:MAG: hypothetical protein ACRDJH_06625 [Thermomicrobiales bacterium]
MTRTNNVEFSPTSAAENYDVSELVQAVGAAQGDDLLDISLAAARMLTTGPERYSLDDVLARFGYTREQRSQLDHDGPGGDNPSR